MKGLIPYVIAAVAIAIQPVSPLKHVKKVDECPIGSNT